MENVEQETARKLVSIQKILKLEPIEKADAIEKATVLGWACVVRKGEFKVGDLCVYFEIDSLIPKTEWSSFLFKGDDNKKERFRLRTVRLRKQISQGLAMPLSIVHDLFEDKGEAEAILFKEGDDITALLNVEKYEAPIPAQLQGQVKGTFPAFMSKTDETRIQAEPQVLERHKGKTFYITEKLDGSSMTTYLRDGEFGICSRNMDLLETEGNTFWKVARELFIEEILRTNSLDNLAIQGELIGEGVQGNKYKIKGQTLRVFSIFDIEEGRYLSLDGLKKTSAMLNLETVPIINGEFILDHTVDQLVELSEGQSELNKDTKREGIVLRPIKEQRDEDLGRLSFKVINPKFLLKHGE